MLGVIVNTVAVFLGTGIGVLARKGIPDRLTERIIQAMSLFVLYVGITGALGGKNAIVVLISLAIGTLVGELLDLDKWLKRFGEFAESKISRGKKNGEEGVSFAEAFVTISLIQCVGAYTLLGALQAGLKGDNSILYSKAGLDGVSGIVLAASLGPGTLLGGASIFVVTGTFVLLAQLVEPLLSEAVIADMVCVGSLIIIGQALNMLKVTELKIMNFVPAMFLPIGFVPLYDWVTSLV